MTTLRIAVVGVLLLAGCYASYRLGQASILIPVTIYTKAPETELIYPLFDFSDDGSSLYISKHWLMRCLAIQQDRNGYGVVEPNYTSKDCWKGHEKDDLWRDLRKDFNGHETTIEVTP